MEAYLRVVHTLAEQIEFFDLTRIPRGENTATDALAALASTSDPNLKRIIPVEGIEKPSIDIALKALSLKEDGPAVKNDVKRKECPGDTDSDIIEIDDDLDPRNTVYVANVPDGPIQTTSTSQGPEPNNNEDWRTPIIRYITNGEVPDDKWEARKLKTQSARCWNYVQ